MPSIFPGLAASAYRDFDEYVRQGKAFTGGDARVGAAANYSHVQLLNPVGSGITVYLRAWFASFTGAAAYLQLRSYATALSGVGATPLNLKLGGAAAAAQVRTENNVGLLGTLGWQVKVATGDPLWSPDSFSAELPAGTGLVFVPNTVNIDQTAAFYWIEA